jgi:YbbR domain-containing protein
VRRLAGFVFHNWPLKLGAIGLAVILYGGMVVLQSTAVWPGTVAITPVNYPPNSTLIGTLPTVGSIRYIAAPEVPVTVESFSATIDLANVKPSDSEESLVNVKLVAVDQRIQIIDYEPKQISVTLDPIISASVPVVVDKGTVPSGVNPGTPSLSATTVTARGAARYVRQVAYAKASVRVDASGLDVNQDVDLVPCKANGDTVNNVTLDPSHVTVKIPVGSDKRSESVPVSPKTDGSPASGYNVTGVDVEPAVIEVEGQADALALLNGIVYTKPISIAGATGDVTVANAELDLPSGVTVVNPISVKVVIHLASQQSTRTVSIGIVVSGTSPDLIYGYSSLNATVTIGGATAALNAFDTSTLTGNVSVQGLGPGTYTINVTVAPPAGIKLVAISPIQVTVTITSPATPTPSPPLSPSPSASATASP